MFSLKYPPQEFLMIRPRLSSVRRRTALALWALALLSLAAPAGAQPDRIDPVVTGAVQVTANPMPVRSHTSPSIAVNPKNGRLALVESDVRGTDRSCNIHVSGDAGRSWAAGGDLMMKPFTDCSFRGEYGPYANAAYGQDGTLYVAFVASAEFPDRERDAIPRHVFLARSIDDGQTFVTTRAYEAPDGNRDRGLNKGPMLAVDPTDSNKVYVGWRQGIRNVQAKENLKTAVAATSDGGRTFAPPVVLSDERGGDYPGLAVDATGRVHAVYWTRTGTFPLLANDAPVPVKPIVYVQSIDGGKTWSKPVDIDPGNQSTFRPPILAADPKSSNLYMTWHSHPEANNTGAAFQGNLDIFFRGSSDGGKSWGDRRVLNDDTNKANQFEPGLSVAPNGRVDVAWFDFRNSPTAPAVARGQDDERGFSDNFYTSSSDGGRTWTKNVQVNDRSSDRSIGVWSNGFSSRFNMGVASRNDSVYFAWQDSRNGSRETQSEDVYTSSLQLSDIPLINHRSGVPMWLILGAGLAAGMALSIGLAWALARRPSGTVTPLARRT